MNDNFKVPDVGEPGEHLGLITVTENQRRRLEALPEAYKTAHERLACELAMGLEEPEHIFHRYGMDVDQAAELIGSVAFGAMLDRIGRELKESGVSFRSKARMQADELLSHSFEIATDPNAPASVRASLIQWTAKMAGHEPKDEKEGGKGTSGGFSLSITFAGQAPMKVVGESQPVLIEGER